MDRASDYGSEGWGFDSLPARFPLSVSPRRRHRALDLTSTPGFQKRTMRSMDARRTSPSRSVGYALVLIGSIGFLISCFLPYSSVISEFGPRSESLFRLTAIRDSIIATAGAYLHLFAGVSIVGVTAALGLKWRRGWARTVVI